MNWYIYGEQLGTGFRARLGPFPSYVTGVVYLRSLTHDFRKRSGMTRLGRSAYEYRSSLTRARAESWYLFTSDGAQHVPAWRPPEQLTFPEMDERTKGTVRFERRSA